MKSLRLASLFLAALVIPVAAHAADIATVFSLNKGGKARVKKGESYNLLAVGNNLEDGNFVQVGADSTLGVKLVDGTTAYFGPNSAFRLKFVADSGPGVTQITLLSGMVSGNFTSGSAIINTKFGTVNLGASAAVVSVTTRGVFIYNNGAGAVTYTLNGVVTTIPANTYLSPSVADVRPLGLALKRYVQNATAGKPDALVALTGVVVNSAASDNNPATQKGKLPDTAVFNAGHVFSPNGEGSTVL